MRLALLAAAAHAVGAPAAKLDSTALLEPHHKTAHHASGGHASGRHVRTIVEWGKPRTATTLQYQIVCAGRLLAAAGPIECGFQQWSAHKNDVVELIVKTHGHTPGAIPHLKKLKSTDWLFVTEPGSDGKSDWLSERRQVHHPSKYTQKFPKLLKRGTAAITAETAAALEVPDKFKKELSHYIQEWSILRQCCGVQMSDDFRNELWARYGHGKSNLNATKESWAPWAPIDAETTVSSCTALEHTGRIAAAEKAVVASGVFQRAKEGGVYTLMAASDVEAASPDHRFTGSYCAWANKMIGCKKLDFNKLPNKASHCG